MAQEMTDVRIRGGLAAWSRGDLEGALERPSIPTSSSSPPGSSRASSRFYHGHAGFAPVLGRLPRHLGATSAIEIERLVEGDPSLRVRDGRALSRDGAATASAWSGRSQWSSSTVRRHEIKRIESSRPGTRRSTPRRPRRDPGLEVAHRVDGRPVDADLEVQVVAEAVAGAADRPDHLALARRSGPCSRRSRTGARSRWPCRRRAGCTCTGRSRPSIPPSPRVPLAAARIGVPAGTAMSTPACRRPQRMPNGDTTGPFTGQM